MPFSASVSRNLVAYPGASEVGENFGSVGVKALRGRGVAAHFVDELMRVVVANDDVRTEEVDSQSHAVWFAQRDSDHGSIWEDVPCVCKPAAGLRVFVEALEKARSESER